MAYHRQIPSNSCGAHSQLALESIVRSSRKSWHAVIAHISVDGV